MQLRGLTRVGRAGRKIDLDYLREVLTITPTVSDSFNFGPADRQSVCLLETTPDAVWLPRHFALRKFEVPYDGVFPDGAHTIWNQGLKLWPFQEEAVRETVVRVYEDGGAILQARCGRGKTVMGLAIAHELATPTLILVHKEFLLDQWRQSILKFTNVRAEDIGLIQQDTCTVGSEFTLALVESLVAREYPEDLYSCFGLIVSDECHRHGAASWCLASRQFRARYLLGLSARASRSDGMAPVFLHQIGPVVEVEAPVEAALIPDVYFVPTGVDVPDRMPGKKNVFRQGKVIPATLWSHLAQLSDRTALVARMALKAADAGRKVVVFSHRLEQLDTLAALLPAGRWGMFVGGMKEEDRDESVKRDILLSTYQMAMEGLDIDALDTLVMATPPGSVEQAVGRILRAREGKKPPLVVDLVDSGNGPDAMRTMRAQQYTRLGYRIGKSS